MRYLEYKVEDNGVRNLTERGFVMISEYTANINNSYSYVTKLVYELDESNPHNKSKAELNKEKQTAKPQRRGVKK